MADHSQIGILAKDTRARILKKKNQDLTMKITLAAVAPNKMFLSLMKNIEGKPGSALPIQSPVLNRMNPKEMKRSGYTRGKIRRAAHRSRKQERQSDLPEARGLHYPADSPAQLILY